MSGMDLHRIESGLPRTANRLPEFLDNGLDFADGEFPGHASKDAPAGHGGGAERVHPGHHLHGLGAGVHDLSRQLRSMAMYGICQFSPTRNQGIIVQAEREQPVFPHGMHRGCLGDNEACAASRSASALRRATSVNWVASSISISWVCAISARRCSRFEGLATSAPCFLVG